MRTREEVVRAVRQGQVTAAAAQIELLLDLRLLLLAIREDMTDAKQSLAAIAAQTRKPGRPRQKKTSPYDASARRGSKPTGQGA